MGCASTSVAGRRSAAVVEEANSAASTAGHMAKVHPLRRMDALDKNNCDLTSLPGSPTSDGGRTEIVDSGYHEMKRMSRMSSESIESMVQHLVDEKPREQLITEVMSLANELVAMEQEAAAALHQIQPLDDQQPAAQKSTQDEPQDNADEQINQPHDDQTNVAVEEQVDEEAGEDAKEETNVAVEEVEDEPPEKEDATPEDVIDLVEQLLKEDAIEDEIMPLALEAEAEADEKSSALEAEEAEESAAATETEESAIAADNADEDDAGSKLHFEMSAEDVEMLEAQLRQLSAPTPSPVPPPPDDDCIVHTAAVLEDVIVPQEANQEMAPIENEIQQEADDVLISHDADDHRAPSPQPENSLVPQVP